jgi:hypothetical protein
MMNNPLYVLNALVVRADSLPPEGLRRARPRYNVNRAGQGIEEADVSDRTLALTPDPQLEWESFDAYWRKIHGPKILHTEGPGDRQTGLLAYYLQQHRVPGGPTSDFAPPYAPSLAGDGHLPRDPAAHCRPYRRPPWDGIAQLGFRSRVDLETFFDGGAGKYGERIVPDEAVFIRGFGFHIAEEHLVLQRGERRRDPIILVKTHMRNPALDRAEFRGRWMSRHASLVARGDGAAGLVRRYAQLVNVSQADDRLYDPEGDRCDGLSVMSFANMNDLEDFLASEAYAGIRADEIEFAADSPYFTALNYVIRDTTD